MPNRGPRHDFLGDPSAPHGISVTPDPVRAAHRITARLLPHYERATWRLRVDVLAAAAHDIRRFQADATSADREDRYGRPPHPADEATARRNAVAWQHIETFLTHGPQIHAGVRARLTDDDFLSAPILRDFRYLHDVAHTLDTLAGVRTGWQEIENLISPPPGTREAEVYIEHAHDERNADGWKYAHDLGTSGAALAWIAAHLTDRIGAEPLYSGRRAQAALARFATAVRASTAPSAPALPAPPPSGGRRVR